MDIGLLHPLLPCQQQFTGIAYSNYYDVYNAVQFTAALGYINIMAELSQFTDEIPENVSFFFNDFKLKPADTKTRIIGVCKSCKKPITGDWKPTRVTSNFISHAKLCTPGKYNAFDTEKLKKRKNSSQLEPSDATLTKYFRAATSNLPSNFAEKIDDANRLRL
jgi:hypothetical protein